MEVDVLRQLLLVASRRSVLRQYRYHKLDKERMSEAEIRYVTAKVLEENRIYYGIEIPTREDYVHEDKHVTRKALVDLVIYEKKESEHPSVFIEFKRGQPEIEKIKKDFNKMMREPSSLEGACFFHILHKSDYGSDNRLSRARSNILKKYSDALKDVHHTHRFNNQVLSNRWFLLFVLDGSNRQYNSCTVGNMCLAFDCPEDWKDIRAAR
jgi:hypothetical protein